MTSAQKPTLTGEPVLLQPFEDGDLEATVAAIGDLEVARRGHPHAQGAENPL